MVLLRLRPGEENERGPLYMESAVSALHSLTGTKEGTVGLEIGVHEGKVGLFARMVDQNSSLFEGQIYAQYPDTDIEEVSEDIFRPQTNEHVISIDCKLCDPEIFPIKRHPQFDDLLTRANMDPIAGITSSLARYPISGMRGHIQLVISPIGGSFRRRAIRFLPLLQKGLARLWGRYAHMFTRVQLARGWRRIAYLPFAIVMGGFRVWPGLGRLTLSLSKKVSDSHKEQQQSNNRSHDREDAIDGAYDKMNRLLFSCHLRISVIYPSGNAMKQARRKAQDIAGVFRLFALPQSNAFVMGNIKNKDHITIGGQGSSFVLSAEEIATLWHIPTILVQTPNLDRVLSKKLEPPLNVPIILPLRKGTNPISKQSEITTIGEAVFRGERTRFGIKTDDRRRHVYIIGKTGMGKSTLLENMVFDDIYAGKGVGVIDPHGDLVDAILQIVPKERSNDVVLFDPSDKDFPISFNILDCKDKDQRVLVASGLMSVFTKLWPEAFSGRMEHILRNTLLALLDFEGSSMLGIMRMFSDPVYRKKVVGRATDPVVRSFWDDEFEVWNERYRTEAVAAIQNKIGQLLSTPIMRNIVGQTKSKLNIRETMDTGKIVLVNLSKGKLGEDMSAFLGSMIVTKFQIDAMSRADLPETDRRDFYLYIDEFQNFATESFADILSEARKYRLSLTMANQYVSQLIVGERNTKLRDAVFGNVGTMVSFQVGSDDAEVLSLQFEETVTPKDMLSLPKYHAYVRLMIDGAPSKPFSVATLPPPGYKTDPDRAKTITKLSRERYAQKRGDVEEKIVRWSESRAEARQIARKEDKIKEREEEEIKKARKKGMKLDEYRTWRDREMWTNTYNALRKKHILGEAFLDAEKKQWEELEKKLTESGGIPPLSKGLQKLKESDRS